MAIGANEDPNERDFRTEHEAVVVCKGQKFRQPTGST